jgi:O-antigen/teichoic acid export membrane protein
MKNTLFLLLAKIYEKGVMFVFFILLAKTFGKDAFGEFSYFFTISAILFVLYDLGGEFYQIREFSKAESLKKFNTIFLLKSAIFLVIFATTFIINNNIYLLLLLGSYYFDSIISIFRSSLYKNGHYLLESKFTIIEKSIFIAIVFANILSIQDILVMYFAFLLSKFIYILILSKKFYKFKYILKTKRLFDLNFAKYYLTNAWSYVLHALLVVVFVQIDIIMLKQMNISFGDIGLYSAAVKIYMTVIIFADVLFKLYYPLVAKYVQNGEQETLKKLVLKVQDTNIFFSIYFAIIIMLFAPEIINFAFGDEFVESSKMLILLSVIIVFRFSMYTYTAILSSSKLNYIKLYTSFACVFTNIVLNYILIPIYGVYGAIISTIITEFLLTVLYKVSSFKIVFTNYLTKNEVITVCFAVLSSYIILNFDIKLFYKIIIGLFLLSTLLINLNKIKEKLNFKGI